MAALTAPDRDWVYFVEMAPFHKPSEMAIDIFIATEDVFFDGDDPLAPNREYNGIVDIAYSVTRAIALSAAGVAGDAQPDYGAITAMVDDDLAADTDAGIPKWRNCAFDGRPVRVLRAERPKDGAPWRYANLEVLGLGITLGEISWGPLTLTFPIGGFGERLRRDFGTAAYDGVSAFETGADLKGRTKHRALGRNFHVTPVLVDAADEWWDVAPVDGFHSEVKVYQGALEYETDVSSPPASGKVHIDMANGRIQTNGMPSYPLTVSFVSDFADGAVTKADIIEGLAAEMGFDPSEIDDANFAAFNTADDAEVGYYVEQPTPAITIVNALLAPGAFHTEDAGKLQLFQLAAPTAATADDADLYLTDDDLIPGQLTVRPEPVPPHRLDVAYAPCATTFTVSDVSNGDVVDAALEADRKFVSSAWRIAPYDNATTAAAHLLSAPQRMESRMTAEADADAEAARLGPMLTVPPEMIDAQIAAAPFGLKLHAEVWVDSDFYRINAAFRVLSVSDMSRAAAVALTLWRPRA